MYYVIFLRNLTQKRCNNGVQMVSKTEQYNEAIFLKQLPIKNKRQKSIMLNCLLFFENFSSIQFLPALWTEASQ